MIDVRKQNSLTQQQVADRLNKPQSYIAKVEKFERKLDVLEFIELCEILNIKAWELIKSIE